MDSNTKNQQQYSQQAGLPTKQVPHDFGKHPETKELIDYVQKRFKVFKIPYAFPIHQPQQNSSTVITAQKELLQPLKKKMPYQSAFYGVHLLSSPANTEVRLTIGQQYLHIYDASHSTAIHHGFRIPMGVYSMVRLEGGAQRVLDQLKKRHFDFIVCLYDPTVALTEGEEELVVLNKRKVLNELVEKKGDKKDVLYVEVAY